MSTGVSSSSKGGMPVPPPGLDIITNRLDAICAEIIGVKSEMTTNQTVIAQMKQVAVGHDEHIQKAQEQFKEIADNFVGIAAKFANNQHEGADPMQAGSAWDNTNLGEQPGG